MKTIKAIKQVLKICPKSKESSTFKYVRFCPATEGVRARVYATDGVNIILAYLDEGEDVPDALLPSDALRSITKHRGDVEVKGLGHGVVELATSVVSTKIQGENYDKFPLYPEIPFLTVAFPWSEVKKIVHAAAVEKYEAQFAVLRFTPSHVEAYDGVRFARTALDNIWTGLVASKLFKAFPAGKAVYGSDGTYAFFQVGDEVRVGTMQSQFFPDTETGIPVEFQGNQVLVDTSDLKGAIECSLGISSKDFLRIEIVDDVVYVYPFGVENINGKDELRSYENTYFASIPVQASFSKEIKSCSLSLDARYVHEALKQVITPNVILGYGDDGDTHHPLRIESGGFTACVWQLVL